MNRLLWIVIILGGILLLSEALLWLSMSPSRSNGRPEYIEIDNPLEFRFVSSSNNVRLIGSNVSNYVRELLKNYYKSNDQVIGYLEEGKMDELLEIAKKHGFRVYIKTIFQDKDYNTSIELYLPYQNFTNRYLVLKGPMVYFQGKIYSRDGGDIIRYINTTQYYGEDEFYIDKILETRKLYVFSFENRSKLNEYSNAIISDRCVLNKTVDYKKDYVYKLDLKAIYVNRSFNDINRIYQDYPVISCDISYIDQPVNNPDEIVEQYILLLTNNFGISHIYNTTNLSTSYKLPVSYTISGNVLLDYEIG